MRDAWDRQRSAFTCVLCTWLCAANLLGERPPPPDSARELQAAKLLVAAALADGPNPDEQRKLEHVYRELVARFPQDAAIRNAYAEFLWSNDERARALEEWQAAERLAPDNPTVLTHLGGAFIAMGEPRNGVGCYARAVSGAPENASFRFNLANAMFLFRHELLEPTLPSAEAVAKGALRQFAEAARLDPLNPEFARAYAETFYSVAEPNWQVAVGAWKHFLNISPQKDFGFANLARVYLKLGENEKARACVREMQGREWQRLRTRLLERIDAE
jgi:tetratricopeptide (TPR) repeat protein